MRKTLGDYNIEKSSSSDLNNISWSQKKQKEKSKTKKKKTLKQAKFLQELILFTKKIMERKILLKKYLK